MIEWQPIETAPKDGTVLLLSDGITRWMSVWPEQAEDAELLAFIGRGPRIASHWMPLPDPPEDKP